MDGVGIELRCPFCSARPLLARCGRDERTGEPWVHIKSWKGDRLYVEVVVISGIVKLRCRDCRRWTVLRIVKGTPRLREIDGHPLDNL